ncbi:hypothetical protein ACWENO_13830 [Streptomyces sp. NPDC004436]
MLEDLATSILRDLVGQVAAQTSEPNPPARQKADQLMALAVRGDKPAMESLIRSWPENEAREVMALLKKR